MTLKSDLEAFCKKTHDDKWSRREGRKIPGTDDVTFGTDAVTLDGTVLYADLADSTGLVKGYRDWFAAEVYKNYLHVATKLISANGGEVTAFDGDRVMGVFIGNSKNTSAVKTALKLKWAVGNILQPALDAKYPTTKFVYKQRVGIDSSPLFIAKTGIRNSNDLVWVGNAANIAAKLAALDAGYASYITSNIYGRIAKAAKYGGSGTGPDMWTNIGTKFGGDVYGSNWHWSLT